ncbi:RHS repeat protein [Pseudomonas sp. MWU13-2860]|nr:RHS repeat protein [Pseudomonas sp. MWU13-2860]
MAGQKGAGQDPLVCPATTPSGVVGNPINALIGNKFQAEYDFSVGGYNPLTLYHYYNSSDQKWTHSYSDHLNIGDDSIAIVRSDGRETIYAKNADSYTSDSDFGTLEARTDGWTYKASDGGRMEFDLSGRLVETYTVEGGSQFLTYESAAPYYVVTVKNGLGSEVKITETPRHEPIAISSSGVSVGFTYGDSLDSVETTENGVTTTRRYEYTRVTSVRNLLAAVIDERGVKFASWSYDYMGRPLSSEHSDGAQKTSVSYLDGASIVTNALGKNVTYRYQNMHGVNRIVSIEGEPSPNCPASNSSYTYNDRGQVLTKTDAKGLITTYSYNDRGLEVSRVEASGTPLARTTITEWDPSRFLKTKVLEPTRSTLYTYDAQGRPLSQQTTPN